MSTKAQILELAGELLDAIKELDEKAPPIPVAAKYKVNKGDKALAHFSKGNNEKGFPKFEPYPGGGITKGRIKFEEGEIVDVYPKEIKGDSNVYVYEMVSQPVAGKILYLRKLDGSLI